MRKIKLQLIIALFVSANLTLLGQGPFWRINGNLGITPANFLGSINNSAFDFRTNNLVRATVTTNNGMQNSNPALLYNFNVAPQSGDGIQIAPGATSFTGATIDLFTSFSNQTFIRMDGTSLLQTTNNRFEHISNLNGFWYNVTGNGANGSGPGTPQYIWNVLQIERGRLGSNGKWRFGLNATSINANNRVEIQSNIGDPYFPVNAVNGSSGLRLTNLTSLKTPIANGLNGVNYARVLSVDQNGDVVLVPATGTANNGLSVVNGTIQLGTTCPAAPAQTLAAALLSDRQVPLNGFNFVYAGALGRVGIGTGCVPNNKLEVDANTGVSPISGLRLTQLGGAAPLPTNFQVLSVNGGGDVILTQLPPLGALGGPCPSTNVLTANWDIPLNNNNFRFGGNGTGTVVNNVGIGTSCLPQAKLHVDQSSGSNNGSIGILVENNDITTCFNANSVIGLKSVVNLANSSNTVSGLYRIGGWFEVPNPNGCGLINNWAIHVPQNGGFVTIGYPTPFTTGALVDINGVTNSALGYTQISDATMKNTVVTLPNSLNKIKNLRPVTFKWNNPTDSASTGIHAGFIAQEVDTVIPQVVRTHTNGIKSISYDELIPYLVSAVQAQQKQIHHMDSIITALTQSVSSCCSNSAARQTGINGNDPSALTQININLSDVDMIVLNQNTPNPFAEQTTITYNVPEKYGFAQLVFKTIDGKIIKTVDITKKGRGQVNVFANDLSNGLYMYSLIVDGTTVDTKKMVKQN